MKGGNKIKENKNFISPTEDIIFKSMWLKGNPYVRTFLERIVEYSIGHKLKDYIIGSNELGIRTEKSIANKVDILLISKDETEKTDIEMNRLEDHDAKAIEHILNKSDIYLTNIVSSFYDNKKNADRYKSPIKVEQVNFNTFHCVENPLISRLDFEFVDKNYQISKDGIKSHHIYLPRMKELCYTENNQDIYKDFAIFMCESYEEMENLAIGNKEREEVVKFIKGLKGEIDDMAIIRYDEYTEWMYHGNIQDERKKSKQEGISEGIEQGKQETLIASVVNFYKNGASKDLISKSLNISLEELETILKDHDKQQ